MAATKREDVMQALFAALHGIPMAKVLRSDVLPERVPAGGLLILRDGEPGEPEVTLSPLRYHWQHRAEVELIVQGKTESIRNSSFDDLAAAVGAAISADRSMGGLCDWALPDAPRPIDLPVEGGADLKAAVIDITLHYTTTDPLS